MIHVKKVFTACSSNRPYSIRIRSTQGWVSEEELIELVAQIREALPKKVQIPFSEHSMPSGGLKVMVPIV